jgi:hypothetical protein
VFGMMNTTTGGMAMFDRGMCRWLVFGCLGLLAACGIPRPPDSALIPAPDGLIEPVCVIPPAQHPLTGSWYVVRKQNGVAGEIQTLLTLSADGKMRQQTRVKQGRNIRSELRETGCWDAPAGKLVARVSRSNGELVDYRDPVYTNTYIIERNDSTRLTYREDRPNSRSEVAQKVSPSFRLL